MKVFLGIDGGGTKTTFALMNEEAELLAECQLGTIHFQQLGLEEAKKRIQEGIQLVFEQAKRPLSDVTACFAGIPGYGEYPPLMQAMQEHFQSVLQGKPFHLGNDSVAGYAGSLKGEVGVNLVLGTGAIAYGMNAKGEEARSSGWGPFCGDEGSAYALGQTCVRLFAKEADGRLPGHILYDLVKKELQLEEDFAIISLIHNEWKMDRTKIASLSRLLSQAAEAGDEAAQAAIEEAAFEGYLAVRAVAEALHLAEEVAGVGGHVPISYSGGVFRMGERLLAPFRKFCEKEGYVLCPPKMGPKEGSLLMAVRAAKLPLREEKEIIQKMKMEEV